METTSETTKTKVTADGVNGAIATPMSRRTLLTQAAAVGIGAGVLRLMPSAQAATQPKQPIAETGRSYPMPKPDTKTELQFRVGVLGPAMLSLVTSQIAVDKATSPLAKEFANFELREAIGVIAVLKRNKTPVPPMSASAKATLAKIKSAPKGGAFDKAYMTAQLANHEFLRDHAEAYLANSKGMMGMAEMHTQDMAMLTLGVFKEHIVHCKNFLGIKS